MKATRWMMAWICCAPSVFAQGFVTDENVPRAAFPAAVVIAEPVLSAPSRIAGVTVYPNQALVTRLVQVPEGLGTMEVVVTPLATQVVASSLDAEGDALARVLSTRFRPRRMPDAGHAEVAKQEALLQKLESDRERIQAQIKAQGQDLQFLQKLEGFTAANLNRSVEAGQLTSESIVEISRFLMANRDEKTEAETTLQQSLHTTNAAMETANRVVSELKAQSRTIERDAVILVQKTGNAAGTLRLTYLVDNARWWPQYRLRAVDQVSPVTLEYLAAVTQQTGEDWLDAKVTLSTSQPSLDAAPPELLPLTIVETTTGGKRTPEDASEASVAIRRELDRVIDLPFPTETPLEDVVRYIRSSTKTAAFPHGIPIYINPVGLTEAEKTAASPVQFDVDHVPLGSALDRMLDQIDLRYEVKDGLLTITSRVSGEDVEDHEGPYQGMGGGMGGMGGGMGLSLERTQAGEGNMLNRAAAFDQTQELGPDDSATTRRDRLDGEEAPSVTMTVATPLSLPSRPEPQLVEVARAELPAEFYAKAVPVLTAKVYRLAKLTNAGPLVILPGEATVYVGSDFVGRMRIPLVASGEPFLAGFGVDPQVQVSRRLVSRTRLSQGGNQVLAYEFRLGVRNFHDTPVQVQLWDRLPVSSEDAVAVNLITTSTELSSDPLYQKTGRIDNLLRWDLAVPAGTVGDKAIYVNYDFRMEYARDLPPPHFSAGGLNEAPIGGGAMGLGGMGGGFRSIEPR